MINPAVADVKLYPNPGITSLSITSTLPSVNTLSIFNLLGEQLLSKNYNTNKVTLDVRDLPNGIYVIKVNDMVVKKFIKQ